jgi:hypothetical protein
MSNAEQNPLDWHRRFAAMEIRIARIDTSTIEKLCNFFGCEVSDLFVLRDEATPGQSFTQKNPSQVEQLFL